MIKLELAFYGFPLSFDRVTFSDTNGDKKPILLGYPDNENVDIQIQVTT